MQGAGGVGGLLATHLATSPAAACYPAYDGNGNISAWIDSTGSMLARMDYSPFGQLIAQYKFTPSGDTTLSRLPFGFSTKYADSETGLLYYVLRYYDPVNGRWPSRDPIEERGGLNLYGFVKNDSIDLIDYLGCYPTKEDAIKAAKKKVGEAARASRQNGVKQLWQAVKYLGKSARQTISTTDAELFAIAEGTFQGVSGVEYGSMIYCRAGSGPENRFDFTGPSRGTLPSRSEYFDKKILGHVAPDAWPEDTTPVVMLHSHTMAEVFFNTDSWMLTSNDGNSTNGGGDGSLNPNNGPPSPDDKSFGATLKDLKRFIVHEQPLSATFNLYEY